MRYLRMLSNSVIAGAVASAYLTTLVLQLNPGYPLEAGPLLALVFTIGLAYGANLTVVFYALIVLRQLAGTEVLSPGWLSVRLLAWLGAIAATGGAAVTWMNLTGFGPGLDGETALRMRTGAIALSMAAGVLLLLAVAHIGRRGGRVSGALLGLVLAGSVAGPLAARGPARLVERPPALVDPAGVLGSARTDGRVFLLMLDGASLDIVSPAVAEGRLPNFGRIVDGGAVLHLATLRPTQAEPVWSAVATGRLPMANGVRSSSLYRVRAGGPPLRLLPDFCFAQALIRFGFLIEDPHDAASLQARPIWRILGERGVPVAVVGWPLTHPAPAVNGVVVSDELHRLSEADLALEGSPVVSPPALLPDVRAVVTDPGTSDPLALVSTAAVTLPGNVDARPDPEPLRADRLHLRILDRLPAVRTARFVAVRLPGVDAVSHYFLRYANPSAFGDVSDEERRQHGRVLEEYYGVLDGVVGRLIESLAPEDLLLVVSAFGIEPLSPGKRLLEQVVGNPEVSGTHERAPDGFLLAWGADVAAGRPPRASVLDVTPTILYYLGLPVARDMDGFARTDLFTPAFTAGHPITFIPTYGR